MNRPHWQALAVTRSVRGYVLRYVTTHPVDVDRVVVATLRACPGVTPAEVHRGIESLIQSGELLRDAT